MCSDCASVWSDNRGRTVQAQIARWWRRDRAATCPAAADTEADSQADSQAGKPAGGRAHHQQADSQAVVRRPVVNRDQAEFQALGYAWGREDGNGANSPVASPVARETSSAADGRPAGRDRQLELCPCVRASGGQRQLRHGVPTERFQRL
jgi:hypothetical protein